MKRDDWTYLVFTYDQKRWKTQGRMWRAGLSIWAKLRKRIRREWGPFQYIQTWEQHRSGAPHVNVLLGNERLAIACMEDWRAVRKQWFKPHAVECGFGPIMWCEPMRYAGAMAGYLTKLAKELGGSNNKGQTPVMAPRGFRRIRASVGLLPPPYKDPDISGFLHQCAIDAWGFDVKHLRGGPGFGTL
jgi:hypothetical protein